MGWGGVRRVIRGMVMGVCGVVMGMRWNEVE